MKVSELELGSKAEITGFSEAPKDIALVRRMMLMGLTIGSTIKLAHVAPFGGTIAVKCRGTLIAMRLSDANLIEVRKL